MPLSSPYVTRILVRNMPFDAQNTFVGNLGALATRTAEFDTGLAITDPNQLLAGNPVGAGTVQHAVGPFIDVLVFAAAIATLTIDYAVDGGASYRNVATTPVAAATPVNVSGLRITGRFVRVQLTDVSGAVNAIEFGAYVRST